MHCMCVTLNCIDFLWSQLVICLFTCAIIFNDKAKSTEKNKENQWNHEKVNVNKSCLHGGCNTTKNSRNKTITRL